MIDSPDRFQPADAMNPRSAPTAPAAPASHLPPPFDAWLWWQACQDSWLAQADPAGAGANQRRRRLARLIEVARRDSPFYARHNGAARELADCAPVGKAELMAHFDDWATDRRITRASAEAWLAADTGQADAYLGRYLLWTSSGTSGVPGLFVQDAASLAAFDAIDALRQRSRAPMPVLAQMVSGLTALAAPWGAGRRYAYLGAIGGPYAGHVSLARLRRLLPSAWARQITLLSVLEPLDAIAAQLQALQPDVLITYPSAATALAQAQLDGRLQLRLAELWLGGEQLSPSQRDLLRRAFAGCTLRNHYGASEFFSIADECPLGQLHLNDDWVLLEGIDAHGAAVPDGTWSHATLLTHLANLTQPLLRYRLNDRLRRCLDPCACGNRLPVIEVQGRADDALQLPGRHGGTVTLLPLVLETVLEEGAGITQFQLLRQPDGTLELRLGEGDGAGDASRCDPGDAARDTPREAAFARCRAVLLACFERQGALAPPLQLGPEPPLRQAGSGKLRRLVDLGRAA